MSNAIRILIVALGIASASVSAQAEDERDSDGTTPLEAVDTGRMESLDEVDTGRTESLDSVSTGQTESLDSVDTGRTRSLDEVDTGRTESVESRSTGKTESLDEVESQRGDWQPPPCETVDVDFGTLPADGNPNKWSDVLLEAQQDLKASRYALERADTAYTRAQNSSSVVGERRAQIVQARDDARADFTRARCAMPQLVEHARRAGVTPGVLRRYEESPANAD